MIDFINSFLGIVVSLLALCGVGAGTIFFIKKRNSQKVSGSSIANNSDGDTSNMANNSVSGFNVNGNNNTIINQLRTIPSGEEKTNAIIDMKGTCQILFIDDENLDTLIKTLKKSGWKNIKRIGDTANLDLIEIRNANIIFVDIKGVGKELQFRNEGVGLAATLKNKYPGKGVVIYSATSEHNLFDTDIDKVDARLYKNAEPIQFSNMIEQYGKPQN